MLRQEEDRDWYAAHHHPLCHGSTSPRVALDNTWGGYVEDTVLTSGTAVAHCKAGKGLIKVNGKPLSLVQPEILRFKVYEPILILGLDKVRYNLRSSCRSLMTGCVVLFRESRCLCVLCQCHAWLANDQRAHIFQTYTSGLNTLSASAASLLRNFFPSG
jgi:hypothetical protein